MRLAINNVSLAYGKNAVVNNLDLEVSEREIVTLLGHNGAGKTTTLKGIIGLLRPLKGTIRYNGTDLVGHAPHENVRKGVFYLGAQNANFSELSVWVNLELAANIVKDAKLVAERINDVFTLFPVLGEKRNLKAKGLSGGQKKMLEIGMALMTRPQLLLVDEPSIGLSPVLVEQVMGCLQEIRDNYGTAILLVEQNVEQALRVSDRVYIMKLGTIIAHEEAKNLQVKDLFNLF